MPDILSNIAMGFGIALTWQNIGLCLFGCVIGTAIGVLPGIGPLTTMAMILPVTFWLSPVGALIMLSGVFYGAQYGGSTTAILVKIPGETSSVITVLDGHAMAQAGRAGPALAIAALGSLFAGSVVTLLIAIGGPPLAKIALLFQSADYVSVMLLGLVSAVVLAHGSVLKAIGMIVLGVMLGLVGTDVSTGEYRMTMGLDVLFDGIGFVPLSMGLFGLAEIMVNLEAATPRRRAGQDGQRAVADARRSQAILPRHGARHRDWNGIRNSPRRRAHDRSILGLQPREKDLEARRSGSAKVRSKAWRRRNPQTMRRRRRASFRCSASAFRPMR